MKTIRASAIEYLKNSPHMFDPEDERQIEAFMSGAFWMFSAALLCAAGDTHVTRLQGETEHEEDLFISGFRAGMAVLVRHLALEIDEDYPTLIGETES